MGNSSRVVLKIYMWPNKDARPQLLESYVENMLHLMIHAFFRLYACKREGCNIEDFDGLGVTGHGIPWLDVATALESSVKSRGLLDLDLFLFAQYSLGIEVIDSHMPLPISMLSQWGFAKESIEENIKAYKDNLKYFKDASRLRRMKIKVKVLCYKAIGKEA
ncbi:hypothetical protein G7Y89_g14183 [Cudoniella acicularis]|uniref:Uncharacterized protein n=1 Tax=Cudoniella acicularis TaxID=354080 RepID=A0A8H4R6U3_9HELO|nr:hypothetical protein G7Y89_g14183 [Cudoniella acicularis]